jgi:hypothetical protein
MYRRQGARGPVQGVLSGPYTGGARRLDASKLPKTVRQRLCDSLSGRSEPSAIAYERSDRLSGLAARFPAFWGLAVATTSFAMVFAIGFGDVNSAHAVHVSTVGIFLPTLLFTLSLVVLLRRRAVSSGDELAPGRWLLPLDLVEVPRADVRGRQVITLHPLGDVRDAALDGTILVLVFHDGSEARIPMRSKAAGEVALLRLEHSQRLLEELTYQRGLDKALAHDPFFELRVDDTWDAVSTRNAGAPRGPARAILHGPAAWAIATAVAFPLATGWIAVRNRLSDRAIWARACAAQTPEALDAYLQVGTAYRAEALAYRDQLAEDRRRAQLKEKASQPIDPAEARAKSAGDCLTYLDAHGATTHPEVRRIVARLVSRANASGDPRVPVSFETESDESVNNAFVRSALAGDQATLVRSFERIFSETCPANIVRFVETPVSDATVLLVKTKVTSTGPTWKRDDVTVHAIQLAFDVRMQMPGGGEAARFVLTMPPPKEPLMAHRPRSLFVLYGPAVTDPSAFDHRVYDVMVGRAFDRLYDELYGLFFEGDPRVPLHEQTEP